MRWWILLLNVCWLSSASSGLSVPIYIQPIRPILTAIEQQLKVDIERQLLVEQRLNTLSRGRASSITPSLLNESLLERTLNALVIQEAELNSLDLTIKAAQIEIEATQADLDLQRSLSIKRHIPDTPIVKDLAKEQKQLLDIQQKRLKVLQSTYDMLYKIVRLTREECKQLYTYSQSASKQYQNTLNTLTNQLTDTQKQWMNQLPRLNDPGISKESTHAIVQIPDLISTLKTIAIEQKSNAIYIQMDIEKMNNALDNLSGLLSNYPTLVVLNTLQKPLEIIFSRLSLLKRLLQKKILFLQETIKSIPKESDAFSTAERNQIVAAVTELEHCYGFSQDQLQKINQLIIRQQDAHNLFTRQLHTYLSSRQDLPSLDFLTWLNILRQFKDIPTLFRNRIISLYNLVITTIKQSSWIQSALGAASLVTGLSVLVCAKRLIKTKRLALSTQHEQIPNAITFWLVFLNSHAYSMILSLSIGSLLLVWKIPPSAFSDLLSLIATHLIFSIFIQISRLWLLEGISKESAYQDKKLYFRVYGILSVGRIVTLFSLLVYQLIPDYEVRNLVGRLLMLFLAAVALICFRLWVLVPKLLEGYFAKRSRYLNQVIRWISFLLPITLLLNSILSLVGYIQLAWAIVGRQSILLMVLCIYPFISELLNELFKWLSEKSIRHLRNGWLWSEAFLKPIYQLLKFCAVISTTVLLFSIVGWREELKTVVTYATKHFNKPLLTIVDVPIDTWKIIRIVIMGAFITWLCRWARELAYRWAFADLKDLGLRNSLSTLTQYIAIFLSVLSTLKMIGITLSVLKYILSGFAIGLSFGLRDLLNNFVTGILLLVERPLKLGDWVTIGEYDGQVVHIGARSITVKTEDHQELMVPNADLFYRHFINWTHNDTVVRITLPLLVNRQDNPIRIRELILETIGTIKKILHTPSPKVYFRATDQTLLTFKIEYYVDLTQIASRSEINSQFLFALWNRFSKENIMPPEMHLNESLKSNQAPHAI